MVGTNLPSCFGGLIEENWHKAKNRIGIHKDHRDEKRHG